MNKKKNNSPSSSFLRFLTYGKRTLREGLARATKTTLAENLFLEERSGLTDIPEPGVLHQRRELGPLEALASEGVQRVDLGRVSVQAPEAAASNFKLFFEIDEIDHFVQLFVIEIVENGSSHLRNEERSA